MVSKVQTLIFARCYWSITRACQCLQKHGFIWDSKVDVKPNFIRFQGWKMNCWEGLLVKGKVFMEAL